jgi:hypothetical protein
MLRGPHIEAAESGRPEDPHSPQGPPGKAGQDLSEYSKGKEAALGFVSLWLQGSCIRM